MPQRRLLASTLAGLLAMVGFPGVGPSTAVHAQSAQDCEEADCAADEQSWEDEAAAEPEMADEFADETEAGPLEESLAVESEPEAEAEGADFAQAEEEEESASEDEPAEVAEQAPAVAESPASEVASQPTPQDAPSPPKPAAAPSPQAEPAPAQASAVPASVVRTKLREFVSQTVRDDSMTDSTDIFATGFVNSLFAMQLVAYCEKEFGVQIEDGDLELDNFRSVDKLVAFVERKQGR